MKVFIMRHGEAEHLAASDAERILTKRGQDQSIAVAQACERQGLSDFDKVLVSPYVRAKQTWQAISGVFSAGVNNVIEYEELTPYGDAGDAYQYISALAEAEQLESVLLVSHLPLVGYLTAEFVPDIAAPMFPTSGLVCIEYDMQTHSGELLWHIHP